MKKLLTRIVGATLGLALAIGVSVGALNSMEATEVRADPITSTLSFTNIGSTGKTGANKDQNISTTEVTSLTEFYYNDYTFKYMKARRSSDALLMTKKAGYFFSVTQMPGVIKKINVATQSGASDSAKYGVNFSTSGYESFTVNTTGTVNIKANKNADFNCSVSNARYFCVYVDSSANYNGQVQSVTVTYEKYSVTYDKNDAEASGSMVDPNSPYLLNSQVTVLESEFTAPDGKIFNHWDTESNDSGTDYSPGDIFSISSNVVLYAQWVDAGSDPYVSLGNTSISGYTGQSPIIGFSFGNFDAESLSIVSNNTSAVTIGTINKANPAASTVVLNYIGVANDVEVDFKNGSTVLNTLIIDVDLSTVTITGLNPSVSIDLGCTLDLGSTITVTATGSCSNAVTWTSDDTDVATVGSNGIVTGVARGTANISVTSDDYPSATMSCAVTVSLIATMQYTGNSSVSMSEEDNNASLVGLSSTIFTVSASKGETSNAPGLNVAGNIRLYTWKDSKSTGNGSYFVVTIVDGYYITDIDIDFLQNESEAKVYSGSTLVNGIDGTYIINNRSFKVQNGHESNGSTNPQVHITSITINFAMTNETITSTVSRSSLSYHYSTDDGVSFEFTNVAIRFGCLINKGIFNALSNIEGYGVMVSTDAYLGAAQLKTKYGLDCGNNVKGFFKAIPDDKTEPDTANAAQKGELVGDYYVWNYYLTIPEAYYANTNFVAVAYIKTSSEVIFLQQSSPKSVKQLAADMMSADPSTYNEDYLEGSLNKLAHWGE